MKNNNAKTSSKKPKKLESSNFIMIPIKVTSNPDLSDFSKLVFGLIYSYSKNGAVFFANNKHIQNTFSKSLASVGVALKELEEYGFILRETDNYRKRSILINDDFLKENIHCKEKCNEEEIEEEYSKHYRN